LNGYRAPFEPPKMISPFENRNTMADDLAPIRNAFTERAGDLGRYLIGEPTAASKRELRWGRHGSFSVVLTEVLR
jgi:hypothetical protein